jgi:uncharacterized protein YndB with AHSA1/START domain
VENVAPSDSYFTLSARINAVPDVVFQSLTTASAYHRWWSACASCAITRAEIDAKQGGAYRIESRDSNGGEHFICGEILNITPSFIAASWKSDASRYYSSTIFLRLHSQQDGSTEVDLEHRGLYGPEEHALVERTWHEIFYVMRRGIPRLDRSRSPPEVIEFLRDHPDWHAAAGITTASGDAEKAHES